MTPPCQICKRAGTPGLSYKDKPICMRCSPHALGGEMMLAFSENEEEAIEVGGQEAGAYLDSIQKTDLATLSGDEWRTFLGKVLDGYANHMTAMAAQHPPF